MKSNSDDSWGSGSGDYRPRGQGKLFSDTEFFEFCGSPERVRQVHLIGTSITDVSGLPSELSHVVFWFVFRKRGARRFLARPNYMSSPFYSTRITAPGAYDRQFQDSPVFPCAAYEDLPRAQHGACHAQPETLIPCGAS